jgi:hypothetical protein
MKLKRMSDVCIIARDERWEREDVNIDFSVTNNMYIERLKDAGTRLYVLFH